MAKLSDVKNYDFILIEENDALTASITPIKLFNSMTTYFISLSIAFRILESNP